jgi:hypothetical protein
MKTILIAATLAMLTATPLVAYAGMAQSNKPLFQPQVSDSYETPLVQRPLLAPAPMHAPRFIGTYQLHDGLLPNGLLPNSPTFG